MKNTALVESININGSKMVKHFLALFISSTITLVLIGMLHNLFVKSMPAYKDFSNILPLVNGYTIVLLVFYIPIAYKTAKRWVLPYLFIIPACILIYVMNVLLYVYWK